MIQLRTLLASSLPLLACALPSADPGKTDAKPAAAVVEAKADVAAPPDAKPEAAAQRRKGQQARGKEVKLEKPPETTRKAFWAAIQAGRKQTAAKDYAAAIASFDAALQQIPDHPRALSGRGYARLLAGELDAAEADLRKALAAPGTRKLEAAVAFNLGLVAEKRGDAALARAQFSLANTLHPSKAAQAKLADAPACPVAIEYDTPKSELDASWRDVWKRLADEGVFDATQAPADEDAAKKLVCTSEALVENQTETFDACARTPGGPWLVKHYYDWGGHALFVIQPADAGQLRVTSLGMAGGGRCGALSDATITGDNPAVVVWQVTEFAPIDVMENDKGEIVDCEDGHDCFSACGEEVDEGFSAYVFAAIVADPTRLHGPLVQGDRTMQPYAAVKAEGRDIVVTGGGCDLRVPILDPKK